MNLTKHIKEHIKSHALKDHPNECCGLIVEKNTKHEVFKCNNISTSPLTSFSLDPLDYLKCSSQGKIKSVYHSHLEEEEFSEADKTNSSYHNVNYIMFNIKNNSFREFNPKKQQTLYLNKPFKVGVNDCFTLVRDYINKNTQTQLPQEVCEAYSFGARKENLQKAIDLIDEVALSYVKKDFLKISVSHIKELKKSDILVIGLRENNTPLHLAVYLGNNMVIHHPRNKHVTTEKVTSSFSNRIIYAYRPQ
jgi:proteasome lid subunit RPN8/RPN11